MDNLYIETFFFAVPYRIIWDNWEKFCGEQTNPGDSTDYLVPTTTTTVLNSTLYDYLGVPTDKALTFNNFAGRAYNLIWNEWFRDENLQDSLTVDKGDGPDTATNYTLQKRGKRHDYFTSALPWPQKGDAVSLPLGTTAPVYGNGKSLGVTNGDGNFGLYGRSDNNQLSGLPSQYNVAVGSTTTTGAYMASNKAMGVVTSGESGIYADLTEATAATINQLRNLSKYKDSMKKTPEAVQDTQK